MSTLTWISLSSWSTLTKMWFNNVVNFIIIVEYTFHLSAKIKPKQMTHLNFIIAILWMFLKISNQSLYVQLDDNINYVYYVCDHSEGIVCLFFVYLSCVIIMCF